MARKKAGAEKSTEPRFLVLRDSGEHAGHGWTWKASKRCLGTEVRNLYTGDYSLEGYYQSKTFVVERKGAVAEFAGNLTNPEKWDDFRQELERLEEFRWPFLVLEFPLSLLAAFPVGSGIPRSRWRALRYRGAYLLRRLNEIELRYKTRVSFCGSPESARDYVFGLFKRVTETCPIPQCDSSKSK